MHMCCVWSFIHVRLSGTPWTVAHQAPLSMGIFQARILEWLSMPSSRGSSQPRDQAQASGITGGMDIFYHLSHQGSPVIHIYTSSFMFISTMVYHRILTIVPYAVQWDLVFVHSIYNNLHLLTEEPGGLRSIESQSDTIEAT